MMGVNLAEALATTPALKSWAAELTRALAGAALAGEPDSGLRAAPS